RVRRARVPLAHLARFAVAVRLADKRGKRVFSNQPTQVVESPAAAPDPAGRARDAPRRRWDRCRGKPPGACAADGREATVSRSNVVLALTLAAVAAWHLLTIRPGHDWGDDFSLYVRHAKNLAEGRPYAETGYVYNPAATSLSPRTYPPVFPLLLAPVYHWCGLNLTAMKVLVVFLLIAFLAVTYRAARRELPPAASLGLVVLLGLN